MSQEVDLVYLWHFEEKKKRPGQVHCIVGYTIQ